MRLNFGWLIFDTIHAYESFLELIYKQIQVNYGRSRYEIQHVVTLE
jgi:hypothetical protein